jgi:hypothetical protein
VQDGRGWPSSFVLSQVFTQSCKEVDAMIFPPRNTTLLSSNLKSRQGGKLSAEDTRATVIAFLYIMKHVKILSYKVTTLHFMYDTYIRGEAPIQLYVQLIYTVPNIQLFLFGHLEMYLTKSVRNVEIAFIYIMKHVTILSDC